MADLFTTPEAPEQLLARLARLGQRMRDLQKAYFRHRLQEDLKASKAAEREFDSLVADILGRAA